MAVRRVEDQIVRARSEQGTRALKNVGGDADGRSAQQPALGVLRGIGVSVRFFYILDRNEAAELEVLVHQRQLFDLLASQDLFRFVERRSDGGRDKALLRHDVVDLHVEVRHEPQVAVGDDPHESPVFVADRNAGYFVLAHQFVCFVDPVVRGKEEGIGYDSVLASLDALHLIRLRLY